MVRAGEGPLTEVALEGSVARVLPVMARQLIGPGELPAATFPGTVVGLLTCRASQQDWLGDWFT